MLSMSLLLSGCDSETLQTLLQVLDLTGDTGSGSGGGFGWWGDQEDYSNIEDDIRIVPDNDDIGGDYPPKLSLSSQLPPIGDQGEYGTCCAWATAYYYRSWLGVKEKGSVPSQWTTDDAYSPLDLFRRLPSSSKGSGCQGTNFEPAFDVMINQGIATLTEVPTLKYQSENMDCDCGATPGTSAAGHKIKNYRQIDHTSVSTLKRYLNEGRLVTFGAELGDIFMQGTTAVISSKGTTNLTGMHAYHALTLSGYDDNKGANGAFEVTNSWGSSWGDNGRCWIDYQYFTREFAYGAFVAYGEKESSASMMGASPSSSLDVRPIGVDDKDYEDTDDPDSDDPSWRELSYDVRNVGQGTVGANLNWAICYCLYNAYDANDMQIVLVDYYTDQFTDLPAGATEGAWGLDDATYTNLPDPEEFFGLPNASGFAANNVDLAPGEVCSKTEKGTGFTWSYQLDSKLNGQFYLVLIADAFGNFTEKDEENNYWYVTAEDGGPITIENGVMVDSNKGLNKSAGRRGATSGRERTAVCEANRNTYTTEEISTVITAMRRSGELKNKALEWSSKPHLNVKAKRNR